MHQQSTKKTSVLAALRGLVPDGEIGFQHVLRIVERQTDELLRRYGRCEGATPDDIVTRFPRVKVLARTDLPTSGASRWNGSQWVIFVRKTDCYARQRFTMMHELAHIIHHGSLDKHFTGKRFLNDEPDSTNAKKQRERAADHFAGCLLMPKTAMLHLWATGVRQPEDFATHFDVSAAAAKVRMEQLGLIRARWMCSRGAKTEQTPVRAFTAATEEVMDRMRVLGLRNGGRPSMRFGRVRRTLHHPPTNRRFV